MQIQGLVGYFSWNPTAYPIGYRPPAIRLGWKPIPSKARVIRDDEQAHYNARYCLPDSHFLLVFNPETSSRVTLAALGIGFQPNLHQPTTVPHPSRNHHCANGFYRWLPTPPAIRLGWKPIPSKARVTRDEVSGSIKHKGDSCLEDSTRTHIDVTMSKRIMMQGTVFQTATFFLSLTPRLRPGLLSLRSVLASSQIYTNQQPTTNNPQPITHNL